MHRSNFLTVSAAGNRGRKLGSMAVATTALCVLAELVLPGAAHAAAPAPQVTTFMDAYQSALASDPVFRAAGFERDAGREERALGRAALLPTISANYGKNRNRADLDYTTALGLVSEERRYNSESGSIQLSQPLLDVEAISRARRGAALADASQARFESARHELMLRIFTLYAEANQAQTELELALAQRDALARQREGNRRLLTSGEGTVTDTLETQARLDLAEAEVIAAQDRVEASREALAIAIGQQVQSLASLKEDFRPETLPIAPLGELLAAIDTSSPSVAAQRLQLAAAGHEASRARAARLPKVELVANLYRANSDTISTFQQESLTMAVGLQLRVPLYSGGAMSANVKQAAAGKNRAAAVLEATTQESQIALRQHRNALVSGRNRIAALRVSLDSAALLIDATERSASAGARTNLDVLQARSQWYQVRRDLSLARYQYLVAYLELRRTTGLLDEGDLRLVAQQFQESSAPGGAE